MLRYFVFAICVSCALAANRAVVILSSSTTNVTGVVYFTETSQGVSVEGSVNGLTDGNGKHGFHVHALGDLSNGCASTGAHFNPYNATHGGRNASVRHVGDLGNIEANSAGVANFSFVDNVITLTGANSIIGRAVVVHEGEDDLGLGNNTDSLTTGNAGGRVACGIIGILEQDASSRASSGYSLTIGFQPVVTISLLSFIISALLNA